MSVADEHLWLTSYIYMKDPVGIKPEKPIAVIQQDELTGIDHYRPETGPGDSPAYHYVLV